MDFSLHHRHELNDEHPSSAHNHRSLSEPSPREECYAYSVPSSNMLFELSSLGPAEGTEDNVHSNPIRESTSENSYFYDPYPPVQYLDPHLLPPSSLNPYEDATSYSSAPSFFTHEPSSMLTHDPAIADTGPFQQWSTQYDFGFSGPSQGTQQSSTLHPPHYSPQYSSQYRGIAQVYAQDAYQSPHLSMSLASTGSTDLSIDESSMSSPRRHRPSPRRVESPILGSQATQALKNSRRGRTGSPSSSGNAAAVAAAVKRTVAWTKEEEDRLQELVDQGVKWNNITQEFPNRSAGAIKKHYYADMKSQHWTEMEDAMLKRIHQQEEEQKWKRIAEQMGKPQRVCERRIRELDKKKSLND